MRDRQDQRPGRSRGSGRPQPQRGILRDPMFTLNTRRVLLPALLEQEVGLGVALLARLPAEARRWAGHVTPDASGRYRWAHGHGLALVDERDGAVARLVGAAVRVAGEGGGDPRAA